MPEVGVEIYENEGYWRDGGKSGHGAWEPYEKIFNFIFSKFCSSDPSSRLLDLGCGPGGFIKYGEVGRVFGLDFSKYAAANPIPGAEGKITYGSIENIPFKDGFFDVVTAFNVMEHLHPDKVHGCLREIFRVSREWVIFMTCVSTDYEPALDYEYRGGSIEFYPSKIQEEIRRGHWCVKPREWWAQRKDRQTSPKWLLSLDAQEAVLEFTSSFIPETDHSWNRKSLGLFIYRRTEGEV